MTTLKYGIAITPFLIINSDNNYDNCNNSDKCDDIIIVTELNSLAYFGISGGKKMPVMNYVNVCNFQRPEI